MQMKPIKTDADHEAALLEIERLWGAAEGSADGNRLEILITLAEAYEEAHFPMESQMTNVENTSKEAAVALKGIVGLRLYGSRNFCATRQFYFGSATSQVGQDGPHYTLGVECPWRIRKAALIIVGLDDYRERAEGNDDSDWEPNMPGGDLQHQKLAELLGENRKEGIATTHPGFTVNGVKIDECGDIQIEFESNCILEVFSDGSKSMQWIFRSPDQPSFVLMNGLVNKTKKQSMAGGPLISPEE